MFRHREQLSRPFGTSGRQSATSGTRNATLVREAVSLADLVAGGGLEEASVWRLLTQAARRAGLRPFEIRATLTSAFQPAFSIRAYRADSPLSAQRPS